ncbi:hypothetical protein Q1695_014658 [Nippostrongylus brasiliensis]|nr:hypothetical protein Q1695_014658 [Nippostrongylus brasiliensis]
MGHEGRVGRTARMNQKGHAVLFLTPYQEDAMVSALKKANVPLEKQIDYTNGNHSITRLIGHNSLLL